MTREESAIQARSRRDTLSIRPAEQQPRYTASLIKRGLHDFDHVFDPTIIDWNNPTIRGRCYKAKKHYGPRDCPGMKRFYFVCRLANITDSRQCSGTLRIFLRSRATGKLSESLDASLEMLYRGETKYRSIDLGPKDWAIARLEFERTFPVSRLTAECQDELLGDTGEIAACDVSGSVTIVLECL
jgi:hypothetical protein